MEVGKTPLIQLSDKLYAKYEALNPGGSIKDRPVKNILDSNLPKFAKKINFNIPKLEKVNG